MNQVHQAGDLLAEQFPAKDKQPSRRSCVSRTSQTERLALNAVYEIAKIFGGAPDPVAAVPKVLSVLSSFLGFRHSALALLDTLPEDPKTAPAVNPYAIVATNFRCTQNTPTGEIIPDAIAQRVFRTGIPLFSFSLKEEFGASVVPPQLRGEDHTLIAVPIRDQAGSQLVIGVLCAYRSHNDSRFAPSDCDLTVMTMVASLMEQSLRFRHIVAQDRERVMSDSRRALSAAADPVGAGHRPVQLAGIIGDSPAITEVISSIKRVAGTQAPVLLRGESGTGKELFARAIHTLSGRAKKPFIGVNCAALSETLLESELFGHEKGAFTSANAVRQGRFEMADGGTLFLDEIGEISPAFQSKLLRVLQEGEFERVGGTRTIRVDVRLITATNRDLEAAVVAGKFRADLYFRICVVPIMLPPLRDRPSDIRPLAQFFLDRFNEKYNTSLRFAADAFDTLCRCKFPGNVRELENCVNRAAALSDGEVILGQEMACNHGTCLSADLWRLQNRDSSPIGGLASGRVITASARASASCDMSSCSGGVAEVREAPSLSRPATPVPGPVIRPSEPRKTANTTREELVAAMEEAGWVQARAARLLKMTPRQVGYALRKYKVEVRQI